MKNRLSQALLALIAISAATMACAESPPLDYARVVAEARRIERLEGSEYVLSKDVLFQRVRLDLKALGRGSDAMYVVKTDEIGFACSPALKSFSSGWVEGRIAKHEPGGDGGHFFTLSDCRRVDAPAQRRSAQTPR